MDFREATARLLATSIDLKAIGKAMHASHQYVRSMRSAPGSKGYRAPPAPEKWKRDLAGLARERIADLQRFLEDVEK
jgi:hypothetical protein